MMQNHWTGCPIALHAVCASAERISFRQINRKTGNRLRQQLIDEETREVVEAHEKARGYEILRSAKASISSSRRPGAGLGRASTFDSAGAAAGSFTIIGAVR
jgi:DNA end-binding protein Ku